MKLTQRERAVLIEQLREEAERGAKRMGCDCTPTWEQTPNGFGPHDLPAWLSNHEDHCALYKLISERTDGQPEM